MNNNVEQETIYNLIQQDIDNDFSVRDIEQLYTYFKVDNHNDLLNKLYAGCYSSNMDNEDGNNEFNNVFHMTSHALPIMFDRFVQYTSRFEELMLSSKWCDANKYEYMNQFEMLDKLCSLQIDDSVQTFFSQYFVGENRHDYADMYNVINYKKEAKTLLCNTVDMVQNNITNKSVFEYDFPSEFNNFLQTNTQHHTLLKTCIEFIPLLISLYVIDILVHLQCNHRISDYNRAMIVQKAMSIESNVFYKVLYQVFLLFYSVIDIMNLSFNNYTSYHVLCADYSMSILYSTFEYKASDTYNENIQDWILSLFGKNGFDFEEFKVQEMDYDTMHSFYYLIGRIQHISMNKLYPYVFVFIMHYLIKFLLNTSKILMPSQVNAIEQQMLSHENFLKKGRFFKDMIRETMTIDKIKESIDKELQDAKTSVVYLKRRLAIIHEDMYQGIWMQL